MRTENELPDDSCEPKPAATDQRASEDILFISPCDSGPKFDKSPDSVKSSDSDANSLTSDLPVSSDFVLDGLVESELSASESTPYQTTTEILRERSRGLSPEPVNRESAKAPAANSVAKKKVSQLTLHQALAHSVWPLSTALVFIVAWLIGPSMIERYQVAATRGRLKAEHEMALVALKDQPLANISYAYGHVAKRIRPSVVHIDAFHKSDTKGRFGPWLLQSSLGRLEGDEQGSGVIVDSNGYIITNEHVVKNAVKISVTLSDHRQFAAQLVGKNEETDIAILKINATDLIVAEWGESNELEVGSLVWAVGSPYGLQQTITQGIISAKHRYKKSAEPNPYDPVLSNYQDLLQTDVAVNPGNSGGPLVDSLGRVVGINTSIIGKSYQGISFAVPSTVAKQVFERIKAEGKVEWSSFGIEPAPVVTNVNLGRNFDNTGFKGAQVLSVTPGSPAATAGVAPGDIIVEWNGEEVQDYVSLFRMIGFSPLDRPAHVKLVRNSQLIEMDVFLTKKRP